MKYSENLVLETLRTASYYYPLKQSGALSLLFHIPNWDLRKESENSVERVKIVVEKCVVALVLIFVFFGSRVE